MRAPLEKQISAFDPQRAEHAAAVACFAAIVAVRAAQMECLATTDCGKHSQRLATRQPVREFDEPVIAEYDARLFEWYAESYEQLFDRITGFDLDLRGGFSANVLAECSVQVDVNRRHGVLPMSCEKALRAQSLRGNEQTRTCSDSGIPCS